MFRKYGAVLKNKTAVAAAQVKRASEVGTLLVTRLKAGNAKKMPAATLATADTRDRLWTLLVERHDKLRRIGVWIWGESDIDAHVPALQAHNNVKKKGAAKAAKPAKS